MIVDVILPCLNEAAALPWILDRMPAGFRPIVVDNCSTDGSGVVARSLGAAVALTNPHFYATMFEDAIPHELKSQEVGEHTIAAFGAPVRLVELAAAGRLHAPGPQEAVQQIWSALHGAVSLELKGIGGDVGGVERFRCFRAVSRPGRRAGGRGRAR
jgi:glycosyltransferase involved in cell wall biosynthesis